MVKSYSQERHGTKLLTRVPWLKLLTRVPRHKVTHESAMIKSYSRECHDKKFSQDCRLFSVAESYSQECLLYSITNRQFTEITGKDNLTVSFFYSGRVKSPEWRRQRRRADLPQF